MNKQRIKKIVSVMLIISLLLGINGNAEWAYATAYEEENEKISVADTKDSEQITEDASSETVETEKASDRDTEAEINTSSEKEQEELETTEENLSVNTEEMTETVENSDLSEEEDVVSEELIATFAASDFETENGASPLPTDDLSTLEQEKLYQISTFAQWNALSAYSKEHDLSGYRFCYILNMSSGSGSTIYDFIAETGFEGLGSKQFPFAGELFANYAVGNITLKLNKPLFSYLSSKATIRNIQIQASEICAGLAEYLVAEEEDVVAEYSYITINNVASAVNYNVYSSAGCVGGLFAHVKNSTGKTLTITGSDVAVNACVVGATAGGLIGELEGNTELCLDGFTLPNYVSGASSTQGSVGGLVGFIEGADNNNITVTLSSDSSVTYKHAAASYLSYAQTEYSGGLFGYVKNADIHMNAPIKYDGGSTQYSIIGKNAGTFAGYIENSSIIMHKQFVCYDVIIRMISKNGTEDWLQSGVGMFAGVLKNSTIKIADDFEEEAAAIYIKCVEKTTKNINNFSEKPLYNCGGLIGYAYNSDLNFTSKNPCKIDNFSTSYTNGNVAGIVGCYEVSDNHNGTIQNVSVNNTRLISYDGTTGGLVGYVKMNGGNVIISDCTYDGKMSFAIQNTGAVMSTGIAKVETVGTTADKLTLKNIKCNSQLYSELPNFTFETYGAAIGIADADFEIMGDENIFDHSGNILTVGTDNCNIIQYYGGLVGEIKNNSDETTRKVSVNNVYVGRSRFPLVQKAFGGLFGKVEENSAVSIGGTINAAGGNTKNGVSVSEQRAYFHSDYTTYIGCIAGEVKNALLYMEPDAVFTKSTKYECDEIGNYGGVIRNRYWDAQSDTETGELLIKDYQVTGTLSNTLATTGDLIRFAIAMNTEGVFMPVGNQAENVAIADITSVRTASYTLSGTEYDLTDSGLMCLGRNDEVGITTYPFEGSFTGKDDKSIIKYAITSYNQKNIGLFPFVKAGDSGSTFKNLDLEYELQYKTQKSINAAYSSTQDWMIPRYPELEHMGGLAAFAKGNIMVDNVSYIGTITDTKDDANGAKDSDGNYIDKTDDYMGGFFGSYIGESGKTLTMNNLTTNMTFDYGDFTHVLGGVIGYVDLDGVADGKTCDIRVNNVELGGDITFVVEIAKPLRESAFITLIGKQNKTGADYVSKCNIAIDNLCVDDVNQEEPGTTPKGYGEMGGFLGYNWMDVNVNLSKTEIGTNADKPVKLMAKAAFGGLVHTVSGKMVIEDLKIGKYTTFDTRDWKKTIDQCGLLVRNGQYLYLDVRDYTVETGVTLDTYTGSYFDELVGFTKGGDDQQHGGIVSIGSSDANTYYLERTEPEDGTVYQSYQSGHVTNSIAYPINKNPNTRYYYDLNKLHLPSDDGYATLDSADDVMTWHLLHYANESIRKCIDPNYTSLPDSYTVEGEINMTAYSIYPTPVSGESYTASDDGTIIFNAQQIIDGENLMTATGNQKKYPEDEDYQHYQMHAGLFSDVSGISVDGLKLSGNYSKSANNAGALVAGSVYGIEKGLDSNGKMQYDTTIENTFSNVILDDLWCVSKTTTIDYDAPLGLMIADISSGANVTLDEISMIGYTDDDGQDSKNAASALIGNVGGSTATYITLTFEHMDIADAADNMSDASLNSSKMDEVLAKASFIYSYDYEENCNAFYLFTYDDYVKGRITTPATGKVTLGLELGSNDGTPNYAKEEYFDVDMYVGKLTDTSQKIDFDCDNYLPYVCVQKRQILVNPKAGSITEGCGTYEDPYIIESTKQLITLYRYFHDEENFKDIFEMNGWQLNALGDDSELCDKSNNTSTGHGEPITYVYGDDKFPEKKKLSKAYYQIVGDIDLSEYPEFTGFGRSDMPFDGVFVGKKTTGTTFMNGSCPTVVMSKIGSTTTLSDYGFIQYAKGCVVKDLCIQFNEPVMINKTIESSETESGTIDEGGIGAGVIATVLGGENIIDNVTVKGESTTETDDQGNTTTTYVQCFVPKNEKAVIGGYVGAVNLGGVILRNMDETCLQGFSVSLPTTSTSLDSYLYTCGIIGRVYDGYVVYDGADNSTASTPLFKNLTSLYSNDFWKVGSVDSPTEILNSQSRSYDIINGAYLENNQNGKIGWSADDTTGYTTGYTIANAVQLQVISMALNAGMLNYASDKVDIGYDYYSRQRSGDYSYVGNVGSDEASNSARNSVIKYDNMNKAESMAYGGYLSQYFDWNENNIIKLTSDASSFDGKWNHGKAILNPEDSIITYSLTGTEYDMSVYGSAFRGLGGRYGDNVSSTKFKIYSSAKNVFHGNLIGTLDAPAKIILGMYVDGIQDIDSVALLNNIIVDKTKEVQEIKIENITLSGEVENKTDVGESFTYDDRNYDAGGFISFLKNAKVVFENVTIDQLKVKSQNYAGAMVAWNDKSSELNADVSVTFKNCGITSSANSPTTHDNKIIGMSVTGGFVGRAEIGATVEGISRLEHLYVGSGDVVEPDGEKKEGESAGGLIGRAEGSLSINGVADESAEVPVGNDITVQSAGKHVQIGGLVGCANIAKNTYSFANITLKNLTVENIFAGSYSNNINGEGTDGIDIIGAGGIIGSAAATISMSNITVGSSDSSSKVAIRNTSDTIPNHNCYGNGGLVGRLMAKCELNLDNCSVQGVKNADGYTTVISGRGNSGGIAGNSNKVDGTNVTVQGVSIESARFAGGFSGWHESSQSCTLEEMQVKDVCIAFVGAHNNQGDIGGIIGNSAGYISLKNAIVSGLIIDSDYCKNAGGFVGNVPRSGSGYLKVEGDNNEVSNSLICGVKAGGVVGLMGCYSNEVIMCSNITIENNKIIASEEKTYDSSVYQYAAAGGFAGELGTNKNSDSPDYMLAEELEIKGNLIACYGMNNQPAKLGGVIGKNYSESYFYDVTLVDNYIGMMSQDKLVSDAAAEDDAIELRKQFLANTPITADSADGLNQYLYYVTDTDGDGTYEIYKHKIASEIVDSEKFYQYCYLQGTFVGNAEAGYGLTKFIKVHVDYTDSSYCPVSDVGLSKVNSLGCNSDMYAAYRKLCAIVYDGELEDGTTKSIAEVFSEKGISFSGNTTMDNIDVPYIFGNLESIWENYVENSGLSTTYRLEENYQGGRAIEQDTMVANYLNLTMENIYKNTYKDEDEYKSPFIIGGNTIPMVVYNSAESGSLDQVIQTYINMLTNNSGGLNSYVNSSKKSINILGANTYKMVIENGVVTSVSNANQSVTTTKSAEKYEFTAVDGDELSQDGSSGTFTLIRIEYGMYSGTPKETKWRLDIPVYVEKRLKIYSNMKMVEGIQYDTNAIKTNGWHVLSAAANKEAMTLARGNSYSIYAEYIYADALDKFTSLTIPKLFYTDAKDAVIPFSMGTKITMLALDEQSKPYYYTVTGSETNQTQIDFSDFKDADGNAYTLKDIKGSNANKQETYKDLCGISFEDVVIERYVLLVDTADVTENRNNAIYEMHISPKELWTNGSTHYNAVLSSRTDYNEHCYEYVNEINGVTYEINKHRIEGNVHANTYLDETSKISKGGSVKAHLQYDIKAESTYWSLLSATAENKTYVDIGFYFAVQVGDSYQKIPLPENTIILFGNRDDTISVAAGKGQTTTYYYQSRNSELESDVQEYVCVNELQGDTSGQIDITFDFSNADMSDLEQYNGSSFSVVAELVVTNDKELPAAGEVKDSYSMIVDAETESDIGFALEVDDLMTLGMNQYTPSDSDSGVVPYTANIAFPTENTSKAEDKYYTIVYQIEKKVAQKDATSGKPEYKTYTGDDVSLYLGTFDDTEAAKQASENGTDSVNSGNGITSVTYKFSMSNVTDGADLKDGQTPSTDSTEKTAGVIKTHCTLVANSSNLNMTNYRVSAYLIVSDVVPNHISGNYISNISVGATSDSCLNGYILRNANWSALSEDIISEDLKNDFFVFTVAKIKTSMR